MDPIGVGQSGKFHWWEGVVEDNLDPTGSGRCRVRVIAQNSPLKTDLSTTELPWAYPIMPLNNPHGKIVALKPGTRVTGFYRDGVLGQDLVMMGTINTGYGASLGFDESKPPLDLVNLSDQIPRVSDVGFIDDRAGTGGPIENQPQKTTVKVDVGGKFSHENTSDYGPLVVNEINTPRLTRGIIAGTPTEAHLMSQQRTAITKPDGSTITEPRTPYAALYPFNTVEESDSGHVREIDDTPGAERIKETHRTGTFYEIHPDGTKVTKVVKDDFSVTIGDKGVKVDGVCAVHVVGQADFYCDSDIKIKAEQNATIEAAKNVYATAGRDLVATSGRDTLISAGTNLDIISAGQLSIQAGGEILFKDASATALNVDQMIQDTVDGVGNARIRVDLGPLGGAISAVKSLASGDIGGLAGLAGGVAGLGGLADLATGGLGGLGDIGALTDAGGALGQMTDLGGSIGDITELGFDNFADISGSSIVTGAMDTARARATEGLNDMTGAFTEGITGVVPEGVGATFDNIQILTDLGENAEKIEIIKDLVPK